MGYKQKTILLAARGVVLAALYSFYDLPGVISYVLPRRVLKVAAMIVTGGAIPFATTIFMTITNNRILTPSVMGLDSLYLFVQTVIGFLYGSSSLVMIASYVNYVISLGAMVLFSLVFVEVVFNDEHSNIYF